jgi:hypothetical protein
MPIAILQRKHPFPAPSTSFDSRPSGYKITTPASWLVETAPARSPFRWQVSSSINVIAPPDADLHIL